MALLNFSVPKYILKKAWTKIALLQEHFYLRSFFGKKVPFQAAPLLAQFDE